jgi:hypothetical protein
VLKDCFDSAVARMLDGFVEVKGREVEVIRVALESVIEWNVIEAVQHDELLSEGRTRESVD